VRLVTFNVLHGRSTTDGRVDVARFQEAIGALDADILALQEVDRDQPRSHLADLTRLAGEAMGASECGFAATIAGTPGERWTAATGHEAAGTPVYGIALLSRWPASAWVVVQLPRAPVRVPVRLVDRVEVMREEPRVALIATFETSRGPLTVAATHLSFVPGWNQVQLRRMRRALDAYPDPAVLLGDLNLSLPSAVRSTGYHALADRPTFPAEAPTRQLDHVLARGDRLVADSVDAPSAAISDHRPLVVDVHW
jgi:endonuclease/exonuclease/phosphatase family metal-dependent hydrolase